MTQKAPAAIIGPGNIGTDLLMKCLRSDWIEPVWMVGIEDSQGIQRARDLGLKTSTDGIDGLMAGWNDRPVEFVFDATSAAAHADNSQKVVERGALMIDLTPAAIGPYCIPPVNLDAVLSDEGTRNVNMVTCGGQATIPMVRAVSRVQAVRYAEIVATVASKSVGMGTRDNIDEFTRTTSAAIASIGEADEGKAIIVINPGSLLIDNKYANHISYKPKDNGEAYRQKIEKNHGFVDAQDPLVTTHGGYFVSAGHYDDT